MNPLDDLLFAIRQHPAFQELLKSVEAPKVRPFTPKDAAQIEQSRAQWIYESGQLKQHQNWIARLTGTQENI